MIKRGAEPCERLELVESIGLLRRPTESDYLPESNEKPASEEHSQVIARRDNYTRSQPPID